MRHVSGCEGEESVIRVNLGRGLLLYLDVHGKMGTKESNGNVRQMSKLEWTWIRAQLGITWAGAKALYTY